MRNIQSKFLLILSFSILLFAGCKKEEGQGGTSTITGQVIVNDYDGGFFQLKATYPAADKKTYIIYGTDHTTYDDDYNTSYDGSYEFKHLQKGKYRIFVYSKDTTGVYNFTHTGYEPDVPIIVDVEIKSNGSTVVAPTITILNNKQ